MGKTYKGKAKISVKMRDAERKLRRKMKWGACATASKRGNDSLTIYQPTTNP